MKKNIIGIYLYFFIAEKLASAVRKNEYIARNSALPVYDAQSWAIYNRWKQKIWQFFHAQNFAQNMK